MVTIDQLKVTVRVEGNADADELAFARLFDKYIEFWQREFELQQSQAHRSAQDRAITGQGIEPGGAF